MFEMLYVFCHHRPRFSHFSKSWLFGRKLYLKTVIYIFSCAYCYWVGHCFLVFSVSRASKYICRFVFVYFLRINVLSSCWYFLFRFKDLSVINQPFFFFNLYVYLLYPVLGILSLSNREN